VLLGDDAIIGTKYDTLNINAYSELGHNNHNRLRELFNRSVQ